MPRILSIPFFICLLLLSAGCKRACKDITCHNGGSCSNGYGNCTFQYGGEYCDSLCPQGYQGVFCNTPIRDQFIRGWSATINSSAGGTIHQPLNITAGSSITYVNVSNFEGFNFVGIIATANSFSFSAQNATGNYTGTISGSGVLNGTNLLINLTRQDGVSYIANCNP